LNALWRLGGSINRESGMLNLRDIDHVVLRVRDIEAI
jgi:hypothetical protein